jgi:hypothetical protein
MDLLIRRVRKKIRRKKSNGKPHQNRLTDGHARVHLVCLLRGGASL